VLTLTNTKQSVNGESSRECGGTADKACVGQAAADAQGWGRWGGDDETRHEPHEAP